MSSQVNDIHWLAGFLDGEGCFYFNVNACRVQVVQKDPWPLQRMQQIVGGTIRRVKSDSPSGHIYALFITGKRAVGIMMTVYALMSPRRQQKIVSNLAKWRVVLNRGACNFKTHCKRGHPLNAETTFMQSNGKSRECRTCSRLHKSNYETRQKLKVV